MRYGFLIFIPYLTLASAAMAIDIDPLWDFSKPDVSEQRFRAALASATGDDALILQTQIARTYGLRKDFAKAQDILVEDVQGLVRPFERQQPHLLNHRQQQLSAENQAK